MTTQASSRDRSSNSHSPAQAVPAFKPVALPALAAAVRSAKHPSMKEKTPVLPAILRKDAMLGL